MSYNIVRTNGSPLFEDGLPENVIDTATVPVALIGKLVANYGTAQSNNFLHLLENFANDEAPDNAIVGTIWYNTNNSAVYICVEENPAKWVKFAFIKNNKDNPEDGDLFYDTVKHKLYIYDSAFANNPKLKGWVEIGPADAAFVEDSAVTSVSDVDNSTVIIPISIPANTVCNVELKIVAKENLPEELIGLRAPECKAWNMQCLVRNYSFETEGTMTSVIEINSNPAKQILGYSSMAKGWDVSLGVNNNSGSLTVIASGQGITLDDGTGGEVNWTVYYKLVKA